MIFCSDPGRPGQKQQGQSPPGGREVHPDRGPPALQSRAPSRGERFVGYRICTSVLECTHADNTQEYLSGRDVFLMLPGHPSRFFISIPYRGGKDYSYSLEHITSYQSCGF
jgi:hypothetical protein